MDKEIEEIRMKKMGELVRKQNDPKTKAREFAGAIIECEEYNDFMKFSEKLEKDQTAQDLLKQFQEKQRELQWYGLNPKTLEELRSLQMKIIKNETIQNFVNSQQGLVDIL